MKKQKSPIALITITICLFVGVAWMNLPHQKGDDKPASASTPDAGDPAKIAQANLTAMGHAADAKKQVQKGNTAPSIKMGASNDLANPPAPTDQTAYGQWYKESSAAPVKSKELDRKAGVK